MDDAMKARLYRAARNRHTFTGVGNDPTVVRRADLRQVLGELEDCQALADGTAFDVDDEVADDHA